MNNGTKFINKKVKSNQSLTGKKTIRVKQTIKSAIFVSNTRRGLDEELHRNQKQGIPCVGHYEQDFLNMSNNIISGGAPNNFLLMRNEKQVVPFNMSATRFRT